MICVVGNFLVEANGMQVEYLVVNYKADDPNVTLSLRQADILEALAQDEKLCTNGGCIPDLQDGKMNGCVFLLKGLSSANAVKRASPSSYFPSRIWSFHVGSHSG
jgi:hypothetical protein